jgi:hypothetical protein
MEQLKEDAATSAGEAADSANASSASATNAANSASAAATSATNAANSANAASASATNAANSATQSQGFRNEAEGFKNAASASATNANASAQSVALASAALGVLRNEGVTDIEFAVPEGSTTVAAQLWRSQNDASQIAATKTIQIAEASQVADNPLYFGSYDTTAALLAATGMSANQIAANVETNSEWEFVDEWTDSDAEIDDASYPTTLPNPAYFGEFTTTAALLAATGMSANQIAANVETNTEWRYISGVWTDTLYPIGTTATTLPNPAYFGTFANNDALSVAAGAQNGQFAINSETATIWLYTGWQDTSAPIGTTHQKIVAAGVSGLAPYSALDELGELRRLIDSMQGDSTIYVFHNGLRPEQGWTQAQLTAAYYVASEATDGSAILDQTTLINGDDPNDDAYVWYSNEGAWIPKAVTITLATQSKLGVVKGSTANGQSYVEPDGTLSLNGYDAILANINAVSGVANRAVSTAWTMRGNGTSAYKRVARISGHNRAIDLEIVTNNWSTTDFFQRVTVNVPNNANIQSTNIWSGGKNVWKYDVFYVDNATDKWTDIYVVGTYYGFKVLGYVGAINTTEIVSANAPSGAVQIPFNPLPMPNITTDANSDNTAFTATTLTFSALLQRLWRGITGLRAGKSGLPSSISRTTTNSNGTYHTHALDATAFLKASSPYTRIHWTTYTSTAPNFTVVYSNPHNSGTRQRWGYINGIRMFIAGTDNSSDDVSVGGVLIVPRGATWHIDITNGDDDNDADIICWDF